MKKVFRLLTVMATLFFSQQLRAQSIVGLWYNDMKDAKIQIFKSTDGKYYGKIVWLKEPDRDGKPKVDKFNSKESLKTRPIMGLQILSGLVLKGDSYVSGTIYDPKSGKTYSCNVSLNGTDKLNLRGYVGLSLMGKTSVWTKAQ